MLEALHDAPEKPHCINTKKELSKKVSLTSLEFDDASNLVALDDEMLVLRFLIVET